MELKKREDGQISWNQLHKYLVESARIRQRRIKQKFFYLIENFHTQMSQISTSMKRLILLMSNISYTSHFPVNFSLNPHGINANRGKWKRSF